MTQKQTSVVVIRSCLLEKSVSPFFADGCDFPSDRLSLRKMSVFRDTRLSAFSAVKVWFRFRHKNNLVSFAQFLYTCGIMIMLFGPIDTQQLSQDSLILQFDITSDYTEYIKEVCPKAFSAF